MTFWKLPEKKLGVGKTISVLDIIYIYAYTLAQCNQSPRGDEPKILGR